MTSPHRSTEEQPDFTPENASAYLNPNYSGKAIAMNLPDPVNAWPSTLVRWSPAYAMHYAVHWSDPKNLSSAIRLPTDGAHFKDAHHTVGDPGTSKYTLYYNANRETLMPPVWEHWIFTPEEMESRTGGTRAEGLAELASLEEGLII